MNKRPLEEADLRAYDDEPTVRYKDPKNDYLGIVESFILNGESLTIIFKWLLINGRIFENHKATFPHPEFVLDNAKVLKLRENSMDFLVIQHAGGGYLIITHLLASKFEALKKMHEQDRDLE